MPGYVHTAHIRDSRNYERVLTIVNRRNDDGTTTYAVSMNRPPSKVLDHENSTRSREVWTRLPGDVFSKKTGRAMAMMRLQNPVTAITIPVAEGQSPLESVLRHIANTGSTRIARICEDEIYYRNKLAPAMRAMVQMVVERNGESVLVPEELEN